MKDLKFLVVTNNFNELAVLLCNKLNEIGFAKTLATSENTKIINAIIQLEIDVVFLDVDYLGSAEASRIYNLIENITGKACVYIENKENKDAENAVLYNKYGNIDYSILKINLFLILINALNVFNNNILLRKKKCYEFIYIVWEDLVFKRVEIKSIREIFKKEKAIFLSCKEKCSSKRIINISFERLYKLLNKNFEKSRYKITNKEWLQKSNQSEPIFLRKSA